mgnify:CR=1 FL=1
MSRDSYRPSRRRAAAIDDTVGDNWTSLPLGALPVEALLDEGLSEAKKKIDRMMKENLPPSLAMPAFFAVGGGWRALAKVHMAMEDAPVPVEGGAVVAWVQAGMPGEPVSQVVGVEDLHQRFDGGPAG